MTRRQALVLDSDPRVLGLAEVEGTAPAVRAAQAPHRTAHGRYEKKKMNFNRDLPSRISIGRSPLRLEAEARANRDRRGPGRDVRTCDLSTSSSFRGSTKT